MWFICAESVRRFYNITVSHYITSLKASCFSEVAHIGTEQHSTKFLTTRFDSTVPFLQPVARNPGMHL